MDLAYLYPHPSFVPPFEGWSSGAVLGSLVLLVALTAGGVVLYRRDVRYPLVGWFWYLGTLVPVIGVVQVGSQANADRYMYVPQIGLLWIVCFGAADLIRRRASLRVPLLAFGVVVALASTVLTVQNLPYWKNSEALFRRAVEVTDSNGMAMNGLGATLAASGRIDEARPYLYEAVNLMPRLAEARTNLGIILLGDGDADGAIAQHREALKVRPDYAPAHVNLGNALAATGQFEEGARHLQQGITLDPYPWQPYYNLAGIRYQQGNGEMARRLLNEALRRAPDPATQMRIRNAMR
jgi:tetratricopeptide (TPR) repeat protein